ncbi:MAG: ATP-dependent DNA ligase [Actinobacteria bacterium]|nr:MAG: ATP-dependent DNA ligase [Actinomycetota bacterium]
MEAELVTELPEGDWQYEPKWDGFRGVMENLKGELAVWSRNARPLLRYFPELREVGELLPPDSALDGEIVIERDGVLDFDAMQMRLHPAESRIRKLSAEIPAEFIAFDVLRWKGEPVHELPLEKRRGKLERVGKKFRLSPKTRDPEEARDWLQRLEAAGLDGVVAKRLGVPYLPGSREGVVKVKPYRTADCVIRAGSTSSGTVPVSRRLFAASSRSSSRNCGRPVRSAATESREARAAGRAARSSTGTRSSRSSSARCATTSWRRTASGTAHASSAGVRTRTRRTAPGARSGPPGAPTT